MHTVATLPHIVAMRLLAELDAAEIAAGSSDLMAPGVGGSIPGLEAPTVTVWVDQEADVERARRLLERIQSEAGDHTEYFKGDAAAEE
ncbi:MAG: hypothetical protein RLZZ461_175 [Planctomycetota bacterium]|jgi:hypothetical protein